MPPIWNLPHRRNPNFTGREELLENLHQAVTQGRGAALTQTFSGLGGVGKTQMAAEYAYRFASAYDLVWWLRAEDPSTLAADYAGLAGPLNLPAKDAPQQEAAVAAVRQRLREIGKWLLIFDNANEPNDLKAYLPQGGGHVIITSRNRAWGGLGKVVPVPVWERDESVAFLLKRSYPEKELGEKEKAAAAALAQELGDLPLALEQAGAYIEACGATITDYLAMFRSRRQDLLDRGQPSQEYPDTVATTWELSFQKVKEASPAAADLLNLCAFLAPDDIPKEMIVQGAEHLPEPLPAMVQDPVALNDSLAVLRRYSLMEVADDALAVHRLVQAVVRDRLDEEGKKQWAGAAVEMVDSSFPGGNFDVEPETWPWCGRLLPHALASAGHVEALRVALASAGATLIRSGFYLKIRAEFAAAKSCYERAVVIDEAVYGPNHPEVATDVNNLGSVLQDLGDLAGARAHYGRALAIDEAAYGSNHPQVAIRLNNLGLVLLALGDLAGARALFERALAIDEAAYGPDHPAVGSDVNNLGSVLRALGDSAGAKVHLERALAIDEAAYGADHPKVAIRVNNLGGVLQAMGDLAGARAHYERTLAILEKVHGPNHPQLAMTVSNLGLVLQDLGDLEDAKVNFERTMAIMEKVYGPSHPHVATAVNNLGSVLQEMGDLAGAKAHYERALRIDEATYGPDHPQVAIRVNNLGSVLRNLGDLDGARAHFERALAILRQFLGEDHPNTKIVRENIAALGLSGD